MAEAKLGCWLGPWLLVSTALSTSVSDPLDSYGDVAVTELICENPAVSTAALLRMWPSRKAKFFRTHLVHSVLWKFLPEPDLACSPVSLPYLVRWLWNQRLTSCLTFQHASLSPPTVLDLVNIVDMLLGVQHSIGLQTPTSPTSPDWVSQSGISPQMTGGQLG